ncbi:hypothetical protein D3C76_895850 [compost metagenome]
MRVFPGYEANHVLRLHGAFPVDLDMNLDTLGQRIPYLQIRGIQQLLADIYRDYTGLRAI